MGTIEKLAQYWSAQDLAHQGGATIEVVRTFEEMHRVVVPDDFREYVLRLNGLAEYGPGADQNGFGFWPLRRIRPVAQEERPPHFPGDGYFVFADYLGFSWAYAIQLVEHHTHGEVVHVGTLEAKVVAPSFTALIDLYLADAPELYPSPNLQV